MSDLTLYHFPPSKYSQIARLALTVKGLPWRSMLVNIGPPLENYEPWYARLNPEMVVPTLVIGERPVCGTFVLLHALEELPEGRSLTPKDSEASERMEAWLQRLNDFPFREFSYGESNQRKGFLRWLMNMAMKRRRSKLEKMRDSQPDLKAAYQARLDDMDPWEETMHDPAAVQTLFQHMLSILDEAETALQQHPWLSGEEYSLADVWMTVTLARLEMLNKGSWIDERPRLSAYYARVKQRDSFDKADIWDRMKPEVKVPLVLRIVWPALLGLGILTGLGLWWWLR